MLSTVDRLQGTLSSRDPFAVKSRSPDPPAQVSRSASDSQQGCTGWLRLPGMAGTLSQHTEHRTSQAHRTWPSHPTECQGHATCHGKPDGTLVWTAAYAAPMPPPATCSRCGSEVQERAVPRPASHAHVQSAHAQPASLLRPCVPM